MMEKQSSQNSNSHTVVRRWFADYCATIDETNELFSSLAKELAIQSIEVNTLSSSSIDKGRLESWFQEAGLFVCRCALSRLRCHYGLAPSGKSQQASDDVPFYKSDSFGNAMPQWRGVS